MRPTLKTAALAILALLAAARADAAIVTWGNATNIAGDLDVSTSGTLVGALNVGGAGAAATTVNGVTFNPLALSGNAASSGPFAFTIGTQFSSNDNVGSPAAPFSGLSAGYRSLLSSVAGAFADPFALTLSGLTVGRRYLFEFWSSDALPITASLTAAAGSSVTLISNTSGQNGGLGQFAVGTFTADAATQTITFVGSGQALLNGVQLRDVTGVAVPEPASLAMLAVGLAGAGAAARARRRP